MAHHPNRLAQETSPYLLQHAKNPVDWYPWGPEALTRAAREDKPILLSIGYAACHWCHVMERESFENDTIAALMNQNFVCIKVDREERPDLDELYMAATVALSGSGGWPMTVFLTPEQQPFFAGTYFPPEERYGRPGFATLLSRVAELWQKDREQLLEQAEALTEHVKQGARVAPPNAVSADLIRLAVRKLAADFDPAFGGFGAAPKFPATAALALLLRYHRRTGHAESLHMVERTLEGMSSGGMYDQLGGGFARYSVDEKWLVPHFEKMLYDNAQLAEAYLEGYQATGKASYRRVARETLDYLIREMQSPSGGFFSSSDADSEGVEGKFFVFTRAEVEGVLREPDATRFCEFYGVTEVGNFEGKNILTLWRSGASVADQLGISPVELADSLERGREKLLAYRSCRVAPDVDDKIITSWNGLMLRALSEGARVLNDSRYLDAATRAARFILTQMRRADGGLFRTSRAGRAHLDAYLEDYAFLADGLLSLYEAGGSEEFFREALALTQRMLDDFTDPHSAALFHTAHQHEPLIARPREGHDGALPSGNAVACRLLGRLAAHTGREDLQLRAGQIVQSFAANIKRSPRAFCSMLVALDFLLDPPVELVLAGDEDDERTHELEAVVSSRFLPSRALARVDASGSSLSALTRGKVAIGGRPTLYLCENFSCQAPLTDADEAARVLDALENSRRGAPTAELGRRRCDGRASPEGTARRALQSGLPKSAFAAWRGLHLSRIAYGGYRVGVDHPEHRESLHAALQAGWNTIDTSPAFAWGDSERLIGDVLTEAFERNELQRDEVFVISRVGVAVGALADELERRARTDAPPSWTVPLTAGESLAHGAFSLDPDFLQAQLRGSLDRLGLAHIDLCLIQNPEHLQLAGLSSKEFESALSRAFSFLEDEVTAGRIGRYGIASNAVVDPQHLMTLAQNAVGPGHHFSALGLPVNLVERAALVAAPSNHHELEAPPASPVQQAAALGLLVFAYRPLSAWKEGALLRLVEPGARAPNTPVADLAAARYRVASLEAEFETRLAPRLRIAGLLGSEPLLPLSQRLGQTLERVKTLEQFEHAERTIIAPRLRAILSELDRAHQGEDEGLWAPFRAAYVQAAGAYLAAVRESSSQKNRQLLDELAREVAAEPQLAASFAALHDKPWSERALGVLLRAPGVSIVATGTRTADQVRSARHALLALPD